MQSIGIIGVGEIGRAIVEGLSDGVEAPPQIHLSPRGAQAAAELSQRFPNVQVCASNQDVIDRSKLVIIAVRHVGHAEALAGLRIGADRVVVSVMAGVSIADLRTTLGTDAAVVRAIPLPAARERRSVTVVYPSHPEVDALFDGLGGSLPVADEAAFSVFTALTSTLTTHYQYLVTLTEWAARQGIPPQDADHFVRGLFEDLGRTLSDESRSLERIARDHETPGGTNERIRTTWFDAANTEALTAALDALLADLK